MKETKKPLMIQGLLCMPFLTILGVTEILSSFRLVQWKAGKGIPGSSRLEFLGKNLANNEMQKITPLGQ